MRTELELIKEAWLIQDACNLSGVIHAWSRAITELRLIAAQKSETNNTTWINRHLVNVLYADKCRSLAGELELTDPRMEMINNEFYRE